MPPPDGHAGGQDVQHPPSPLDQAVADPPAVDDEAAVVGVEFATQAAGMGVEGASLGGAAVGPDRRQQLFLGEDAGGVGGEDAKEGELFLREGDEAVADGDAAAAWVDPQLADPAWPSVGVGAPAKDGVDARPQLAVPEGL